MEGFIYELAAGAGQTLMRPWMLFVALVVVIAILSGLAGRIAIAVENRLAAPTREGTTPPRHTVSAGGE